MSDGSFAEQFAHTLSSHPPADWEPLAVHLDKVAYSASTFADAFGARSWGEVLGRCHDLGKLSDEFQLYLRNAGAASVDAGAEDDSTPGNGKRLKFDTKATSPQLAGDLTRSVLTGAA
jgi:CRISPR-associated endonuclease/helicase Cas3